MQTASGPSPLLSLLLQSRCSGRVPCATHRDTVGLKTPLKSVLCCGAHPCEEIPPWGSRDYLRLVYAVLAHRRSWRSSANAYPQPPPGHQLCPALQPLSSLPRRPALGTGIVFGLGEDGRIRPLQRLDGTTEPWSPRFYCCHAESQGSAPQCCRL